MCKYECIYNVSNNPILDINTVPSMLIYSCPRNLICKLMDFCNQQFILFIVYLTARPVVMLEFHSCGKFRYYPLKKLTGQNIDRKTWLRNRLRNRWDIGWDPWCRNRKDVGGDTWLKAQLRVQLGTEHGDRQLSFWGATSWGESWILLPKNNQQLNEGWLYIQKSGLLDRLCPVKSLLM